MGFPKWVCRSKHFLPHVNGRRGAFLLLWGIIFLCLGMSYFVTGRVPPALKWLTEWGMQGELLGILWTIPAIFALAGAFQKRPLDAYAFAALVTAPVIWTFLYIIGCFLTGEFTAVLGVIVFAGIGATFGIVAGMEGSSDRAERIQTSGDS